MILEEIRLPSDWYKLQLNSDKQTSMYVNLKENVCSLAPVFHLHQVPMVLKDYLDIKVDMKEMERTLQKFKNQINLQCNIHPLIDENSQLLNPNDEHVQANRKLNEELSALTEGLVKQISVEMDDLVGTQNDEVSLLNQISGQYFQCIPQYEAEEYPSDNPKMRFYCSVRLNSHEVGRGLAQNKRQGKQLAAQVALKNLAPQLYEQWIAKRKGTVEFEQSDELIDINKEEKENMFKAQLPISQQADIQKAVPSSKNEIKPDHPMEQVISSQVIITQETSMQGDQVIVSQDAFEEDCQIDDPELLTTKKHLTARWTPLTIVKSIIDKHKNLSIVEEPTSFKHPLLTNQQVYVDQFTLKGYGVIGRAEDTNKQKARHTAAQKFLRNLFPPDFTWVKVTNLIATSKEPLKTFMEL